MKRIYLCGPIHGCDNKEASTWRERVKKNKGFDFVDPMRRDYRGIEDGNVKEIVELDKQDILSCDAILVMYKKPSVGTSMEIYFAWSLHIPVIVINESNGSISPWLQYHATEIFDNVFDASVKLKDV
jgi:nucleoside 2-deoxyribosyltransferase